MDLKKSPEQQEQERKIDRDRRQYTPRTSVDVAIILQSQLIEALKYKNDDSQPNAEPFPRGGNKREQ